MKSKILTQYRVGPFRKAGLEARWSKSSSGAPIILVRNPDGRSDHQRKSWWMVTQSMWDAMNRSGIIEGFDQATLLGDVFSIPA